jgi:hypothetical protein
MSAAAGQASYVGQVAKASGAATKTTTDGIEYN